MPSLVCRDSEYLISWDHYSSAREARSIAATSSIEENLLAQRLDRTRELRGVRKIQEWTATAIVDVPEGARPLQSRNGYCPSRPVSPL